LLLFLLLLIVIITNFKKNYNTKLPWKAVEKLVLSVVIRVAKLAIK